MAVIKANIKEIGYAALALAIIEGFTPEGALQVVETGEEPKIKFNNKKDVIDMAIMKIKENMTYAEIGEIYNLSKWSVYSKIRRFRDKKNPADMKKLHNLGLVYHEIGKVYKLSKQYVWKMVKDYERSQNGSTT